MSGFCGWRSLWSEGWKESVRVGWERGWGLWSLESGADLKNRDGARRAIRGLGDKRLESPSHGVGCGAKFMRYD